MSALSSEVAGEALRRGQDKSVAAARSGWRSSWRRVALPLPLCIPGVLLLRLLFHLARRRRPDYTLAESHLPYSRGSEWQWCGAGWLADDDATGGVDRSLVRFNPFEALSNAPKRCDVSFHLVWDYKAALCCSVTAGGRWRGQLRDGRWEVLTL